MTMSSNEDGRVEDVFEIIKLDFGVWAERQEKGQRDVIRLSWRKSTGRYGSGFSSAWPVGIP